MRNISSIIASILALLPDPATVPDFSANITSLGGELTSLQRKASYAPPEDATLWPSLTTLLYKYLPPASPTSGNTWAYQISLVVTGAAPAQKDKK